MRDEVCVCVLSEVGCFAPLRAFYNHSCLHPSPTLVLLFHPMEG